MSQLDLFDATARQNTALGRKLGETITIEDLAETMSNIKNYEMEVDTMIKEMFSDLPLTD